MLAPDPWHLSWPTAYTTGPIKHMHALGVISLNFNVYETSLCAIYALPLITVCSFEACLRMFGDLSNELRLTQIENMYSSDAEAYPYIGHLRAHFSVCAEKRNLILHAWLAHQQQTHGGLLADLLNPDDVQLHLAKASRDDWSQVNYLKLKLENLRAIADEMHEGAAFTIKLVNYLRGRNGNLEKRAEQPALPEKPRIPRKLNPRPLDEAQPADDGPP